MRRPKIFRCYRCNELRNGKPAMTVNELPMCQHCYRETQGLPPLKEAGANFK